MGNWISSFSSIVFVSWQHYRFTHPSPNIANILKALCTVEFLQFLRSPHVLRHKEVSKSSKSVRICVGFFPEAFKSSEAHFIKFATKLYKTTGIGGGVNFCLKIGVGVVAKNALKKFTLPTCMKVLSVEKWHLHICICSWVLAVL